MQSLCRSKLSWFVALAVALSAQVALAQGTGKAGDSRASAQATKAPAELAYLGVEVESLHPSLASHLPGALTNGQGVLVSYVEPNSPAEKSGLREHDVLTTLDDQKLFAPEQLAKLVRADKPQHQITLGIVRGGQSQQLKVTLGAQPSGTASGQGRWEPRGWDDWRWALPD